MQWSLSFLVPLIVCVANILQRISIRGLVRNIKLLFGQ
jgi:hypothetical protein